MNLVSHKGVLLACIVAWGLFVASRTWMYKPTMLETAASVVMYPFVCSAQLVAYPFRSVYEYCADMHASCVRYRALKEQLIASQAELIAYYATEDYHNQIRELISFEYAYDMSNAICAQVIVREISPHAHECYVDAGSNKGAAVDMVAVFKNCLIGRVDQVYPQYSKIIFITDPRSKVGVYTHKTNASGICHGMCDTQSMVVKYVSHLDVIEEGDMVISRGQGLVYPQGFALGTVRAYQQCGVEYECFVTPLIQPEEVSCCYLFAKG